MKIHESIIDTLLQKKVINEGSSILGDIKITHKEEKDGSISCSVSYEGDIAGKFVRFSKVFAYIDKGIESDPFVVLAVESVVGSGDIIGVPSIEAGKKECEQMLRKMIKSKFGGDVVKFIKEFSK